MLFAEAWNISAFFTPLFLFYLILVVSSSGMQLQKFQLTNREDPNACWVLGFETFVFLRELKKMDRETNKLYWMSFSVSWKYFEHSTRGDILALISTGDTVSNHMTASIIFVRFAIFVLFVSVCTSACQFIQPSTHVVSTSPSYLWTEWWKTE